MRSGGDGVAVTPEAMRFLVLRSRLVAMTRRGGARRYEGHNETTQSYEVETYLISGVSAEYHIGIAPTSP